MLFEGETSEESKYIAMAAEIFEATLAEIFSPFLLDILMFLDENVVLNTTPI